MKKSIREFLEFNGHNMYFKLVDGVWWIALKPICEALKVDWRSQHKAINRDKILRPVSSVQTIQVRKDQAREMFCLPEFFVYGWLFKIRSESESLEEYQWECYRILHEHFQGTTTKRQMVLSDRMELKDKIDGLKEELQENEKYRKLADLEKEYRMKNTMLKKMDEDLMSRQGEFDFGES